MRLFFRSVTAASAAVFLFGASRFAAHHRRATREPRRNADANWRRSHWKLRGPVGVSIEYDAELTQDEPNKAISWNSRDGEMNTTGSVTFSEHEDNTLVHVIMQWASPPGGPIGEAASHILQ